jgi:hypothetical protein
MRKAKARTTVSEIYLRPEGINFSDQSLTVGLRKKSRSDRMSQLLRPTANPKNDSKYPNPTRRNPNGIGDVSELVSGCEPPSHTCPQSDDAKVTDDIGWCYAGS